MDFSIIIPCYNVTATIGRCLDSIYSQGLEETDFEVICVDDCSPDPASVNAIETYTFQGRRPANLTILRHSTNRRQGAARNTGLATARGDFILFIDADDYYIESTLQQLQEAKRENDSLEFIMFDGIREEGNEVSPFSQCNTSDIMSGSDFFLKQAVPLEPFWMMYKRSAMLQRHFCFPEDVLFEDTPAVTRFIIESQRCRFVPICTYYYTKVPDTEHATNIGNNPRKIIDFFTFANRMYEVYEDALPQNKAVADKVLTNYVIYYRRLLLHYIWRLPYSTLLATLRENRLPIMTGDIVTDVMTRHPLPLTIVLSLLRPLLYVLASINHYIKKNR